MILDEQARQDRRAAIKARYRYSFWRFGLSASVLFILWLIMDRLSGGMAATVPQSLMHLCRMF